MGGDASVTGGVILEESFLIRRLSLNFNKPALAPAPGLRLGRRGAKGASAAGQGFLHNDKHPTKTEGLQWQKFFLALTGDFYIFRK
jgi:hypothetical protein